MKAGSPCKSATLRRAPAQPGGPHRRAARATAGGKEGENVAETNKAAVQRVTRKLLQRAEELLDGAPMSSADLDKLAGVLKDAAAVLGVKSALDAREQRGKIAVLMLRAGGEDKQQGPLVIAWEDDTEEAAE